MDEGTKARIDQALRHWVDTRELQEQRARSRGTGQEGTRSAVTGGAHLDGINQLVIDEIRLAGEHGLIFKPNPVLPGYYRPSKKWDMGVFRDGAPILVVEYKSMKGSEGKNLNNRADEVFGVAEDTRQAELHGLLPGDLKRAYIFVMGMTPASTRAGSGRFNGVHGTVDKAFHGASYLQRAGIMCQRLRETGLYDLTWAVGVREDPFEWEEPYPEVGWDRLAEDIRKEFS